MRISILDLKMSKIRIAQIASISAGAVMALGFMSTASAATIADIQAQINALMAQLSALQGTTVSTTFTTNLTVGSSGAQVVALQSFLESKGYLVMPVGVAKGYFGGLTRAAVARFQAANSITPAVGYFGPITRGILNGMVVAAGTPVGGTTTGGTTTGGTTGSTSGVITTPGVEGTITVSLATTPSAGTTVREGDVKASVIGIDVKAQTSDIKVERVKLNLDSNYNKIFSKVYLTDPAGNVLASSDLNSNTVIRDGSTYSITLSGFGYVVPKNSTQTLTVKADLYGSIDSTVLSTSVTVPQNGVRGVDGAGIDQYGPAGASGIVRTLTIGQILADAATFAISTSASTPKSSDVIASGGAGSNEADQVTIGAVDVRAEKDSVLFTDFQVTIAKTGTGTATATTAYLFDGNTQIASASVDASTGIATFSSFDLTVPKDTTKTLTVKVDIRSANGTAANLTFSVTAPNIVATIAENSQGSDVNVTGSATGNAMVVRNVGPVFTLLSKTISKSTGSLQNNISTSSASATFNVQVKAVGGNLSFGVQSSTTAPMFVFGTYKGSTLTTLYVASTSSLTIPSGLVVTGAGTPSETFTVQNGNTVTIPVNFLFEGRTVAGAQVGTDNYSVGIQQINWIAGGVLSNSTYMAGQSDWRTDYVALP